MTNETHSHPINMLIYETNGRHHPTTVCSMAAHLYFQWVAACRDGLIIGSNPPEMTEEGRNAGLIDWTQGANRSIRVMGGKWIPPA